MFRQTIKLEFTHRVAFSRGVFDPENPLLGELLSESCGQGFPRALVLIDSGLAKGNPDLAMRIKAYTDSSACPFQLAAEPILIEGGELAKNRWSLVEAIWAQINRCGLDRHAYVFAVGGGAFQDITGFATSTAHRGIRLVRFPTTTLSQGDGGVGVKNGVNYFGKKNWIGTFSVPFAVVNDLNFLDSLPRREKRAGIIEAIKVALIRDRAFFEELEDKAVALHDLEGDAIEFAIRRSAQLHIDHIAKSGDPFEFGSARPLDFGHWAAHKLEQVTDFSVNHGEAVAVGMALDILYSVSAGILDKISAERILNLIESVGFATWHPGLKAVGRSGSPVILEGLEEFREHLGGQLTVTLVPKIGSKVEVHSMEHEHILGAISALDRRSQPKPVSAAK